MRRLSVILFVLILFASCQHKELCYDHTHVVPVQVTFDWSEAPDASPKSMSLYFFPVDGGEPMRYEFSELRGGNIRVPAGHYNVMCINSDTEYIRYRNKERFETFEVYPRDAEMLSSLSTLGLKADDPIPRAPGTEEQRLVYEPDRMWNDRMRDVVIESGTESIPIILSPKSIVEKYKLTINNVENLKYANGVGSTVTGMAAGYLTGTGELSSECVTHAVELKMSSDKTQLTGEFYTFGHCPDKDHIQEHKFVVYSVISDGSKWYYTFDVTKYMHELPEDDMPEHPDEDGVKEIVLDGLPLPKPITNGGGFQPEVGDWETEHVEIQM